MPDTDARTTTDTEETTVTTAEVLEAPAFRIVLPDGEAHRVVADDEASAKRALRAKLEITRLPAGCRIEAWQQVEPVEVPVEERATASAPRKPAKAPWKELPDDELAAYLLAHVTLGDAQWSHRAGGESRRKGEKRDAFIRRVLLGEAAGS